MVGFLGLTPGTVFAGEYEVRRLLARGMGTIYVVFDRTAGEERALKVLLPELVADERMRKRFQREARVATEIASEFTPTVHHAGIDDAHGVPYIVMDLLQGQDLRQYIDQRGALRLSEATPILEQIGRALEEAHARGLVHRDLKPDNIFIDHSRGDGCMAVKNVPP